MIKMVNLIHARIEAYYYNLWDRIVSTFPIALVYFVCIRKNTW